MGKIAAIPVNMTTWPERSQKTGPGRRFEACGAVTGRGCSISQASASMLCESLTGMQLTDAEALTERFRAMLQGDEVDADLGDLEALRGVRAYPVRVKCATLPWTAFLEGLSGRNGAAGS